MKIGAGTKKRNQQLSIGALLLLLIVSGLCIVSRTGASSALCDETLRAEEEAETMAGGLMGAPKEVKNSENALEIDDVAQFAVKEHNTKEGKNLTFKKVVTVKKQVVAGTMYHLTLEASEAAEQPKLYDAKVWTKPWMSHKTLEHFKEAETSSSVSSDTSGASGLRDVSVEDPVIKEAAEHALKGLNNKSNSLVPYELKEILSAQAEASDEDTQFQLQMKVSKGTKEENVNTGLHRTAEGKWTVKNSTNLI